MDSDDLLMIVNELDSNSAAIKCSGIFAVSYSSYVNVRKFHVLRTIY